MINEAIILAGGLGTRLRSVVEDVPKSMAAINGKPFLEHLLDFLMSQGVSSFIFSVGYKSSHIEDHFGTHYKGSDITYAHEKTPLGTGGAIKHALSFAVSENVLILNGDTLFQVDLTELTEFHLYHKADVSLGLKTMHKFDRYGSVKLSENGEILKFEEKKYLEEGLINGGVYIFRKSIFDRLPTPEKFAIEKDFFEKYTGDIKLYGLKCDAYFLDIGIPEDYQKAQIEFKELKY